MKRTAITLVGLYLATAFLIASATLAIFNRLDI